MAGSFFEDIKYQHCWRHNALSYHVHLRDRDVEILKIVVAEIARASFYRKRVSGVRQFIAHVNSFIRIRPKASNALFC